MRSFFERKSQVFKNGRGSTTISGNSKKLEKSASKTCEGWGEPLWEERGVTDMDRATAQWSTFSELHAQNIKKWGHGMLAGGTFLSRFHSKHIFVKTAAEHSSFLVRMIKCSPQVQKPHQKSWLLLYSWDSGQQWGIPWIWWETHGIHVGILFDNMGNAGIRI